MDHAFALGCPFSPSSFSTFPFSVGIAPSPDQSDDDRSLGLCKPYIYFKRVIYEKGQVQETFRPWPWPESGTPPKEDLAYSNGFFLKSVTIRRGMLSRSLQPTIHTRV